MRNPIATTLPLLIVLGAMPVAMAHTLGSSRAPAPIDEQALRLEADVAAMVEAAGSVGDTDPAKLGQKSLFGATLRWPQGKVLTVCMEHRSQPLRALIAKVASEWLPNRPNISFDFGSLANPRRCSSPTAASDIRIADQPASALSPFWSWTGIQALSHAREWTMDLGFDDGRDPDAAEALRWAAEGRPDRNYFHFVVLHEFGHALGALHEHQFGTCVAFLDEKRAIAEVFPSAKTDKAKRDALANLAQLQKTQIDAWGAVRLTAQEDRESVMRYDFPDGVYKTGAPTWCSHAQIRHVSDGDLLGLGKAYPRPGEGVPAPGVATAARAVISAQGGILNARAMKSLVELSGLSGTTTDAPSAAPARPGAAGTAMPGAAALLNRLAAPLTPRRSR